MNELEANGIHVPRLRNIVDMKDAVPFSEKEIEETARANGKYYLGLCKDENTGYLDGRHICRFDKRQSRGQARRAYRRTIKEFQTFNKYCGQSNIVCAHARVGGWNWKSYGCSPLEKHKRFICKVDNGFDQTFCDIYWRIE